MMTDPIADMLTRVRNAQKVRILHVAVPFSRQKLSLARILQEEGYIADVETVELRGKKEIKLVLKYDNHGGVIRDIVRVSKPGLRIYRGKANIPYSLDGMGITVVSTNKGLITDKLVCSLGVGGEVICHVS